MRILFATPEAVPFAKTGGLADVASGLARGLDAAGHQVTLVLPYHRQQVPQAYAAPSTGLEVTVPVGDRNVSGEIHRTTLPDSSVTVLLVNQPAYFDRPGLYTVGGRDFPDNSARFAFFSRAVMETARLFELHPEVIHVHDWQTGLVPALLEIEYRSQPDFARTASVLTIHNLAFQGQFWHWDMPLTGLDWKYFNWRQMEFYGHVNLLKTGIVFADMLTTVSPTYAREICTPEFGCGLHGVLRERSGDLVGILNGVDTGDWNPAADRHLPQKYDADTWRAGKAACKQALQQELGLPQRADVPLLAMVSRLTDQKGLDLIAAGADELLSLNAQFVFLGTGDPTYEKLVQSLAERAPERVTAVIGFDEPLAHRIEAGSDIYLMPSRFEPCGLNQQYSMLYGTVPVVHAVGGLADSVIDASQDNQSSGKANGFRFERYGADHFLAAVLRALELYRDEASWGRLVRNGMTHDWSWNRSAREYETVYRRAIAGRR